MPRYSASGAWLCHAGKLRRANEDSCLVAGTRSEQGSTPPQRLSVAGPPWLIAVSDGIGGHRGGAEASRFVIEELAACARVTPAGVAATLQRVNRELWRRGRKNGELTGMGATIAGVGCGARGLFAFNVGDSRVYEWKEERLVQITRDDSEAEDLIGLGLLDTGDGARPNFLHALTQAVGGREHFVAIEVHVHPVQAGAGTRLLICSDGLTDMLSRGEMQAVLAQQVDAEAVVRGLFDAAMAKGGMDNITLVVLDVAAVAKTPRPTPPPTPPP